MDIYQGILKNNGVIEKIKNNAVCNKFLLEYISKSQKFNEGQQGQQQKAILTKYENYVIKVLELYCVLCGDKYEKMISILLGTVIRNQQQMDQFEQKNYLRYAVNYFYPIQEFSTKTNFAFYK